MEAKLVSEDQYPDQMAKEIIMHCAKEIECKILPISK